MATWEAQPHTLAKITILRKYLDAWFAIMGRAAQGHDLFYIDGFAGPGRYDRGEAGSPLAAVESAISAIDSAASAQSWVARDVNCLFVESDEETVLRLEEELAYGAHHARVRKKIYRGEFDRVLDQLSREFPCALGSCPLFVFLDPFGATGLSFQKIASILRSTRSEVFLHFDHDGAARIISSLNRGYNQAAAESLTRVFGDRSWKEIAELQQDGEPSFDMVARKLVSLYVRRIRTIAKFAYPFQMITPKRRAMSEVGYHLVFASNHPRGLEKMKRAMKSVGQDGQYKFSNFLSSSRYSLWIVRMHFWILGFSWKSSWEELEFLGMSSNDSLLTRPDSRILERCWGSWREAEWLLFTLRETGEDSPTPKGLSR